jgi:hypothetical protein
MRVAIALGIIGRQQHVADENRVCSGKKKYLSSPAPFDLTSAALDQR